MVEVQSCLNKEEEEEIKNCWNFILRLDNEKGLKIKLL
jgi:hypothetical protein